MHDKIYKNARWKFDFAGGSHMGKKGYSRKGFFRETILYDANGNKVGESRKNYWSGIVRYSTEDE